MTPQIGTGPPELEAITTQGSFSIGSNLNKRQRLSRLQEAELEPSCAERWDGEEDYPCDEVQAPT